MMEDVDEDEVNFDQAGLLDNRKKPSRFSSWCQNIIKIFCLSLAFLSLGLCIAIPGPTLLDLQDQIKTDTSRLTLIFSARSIGYLLGAFFGGFLFDIFNKQLLLCVTLFLASIATAIIPWSLTLAVLAVMFSIQGLAMGVLDTGGNTFCVIVWGKRSSPYVQIMHFAFGIGAFIAPILSQPFLSQDKPLTLTNIQGNVPVLIGSPFDPSFHNNITHMRKREVPFANLTSNSTQLLQEEEELNFTSSTPLPVLTIATTTVPKKPTSASDEHLSSSNDNLQGKNLKNAQDMKEKLIKEAKKNGDQDSAAIKIIPPQAGSGEVGMNTDLSKSSNATDAGNETETELPATNLDNSTIQRIETTTVALTTTLATTTSTVLPTTTSTSTTTPTTTPLLSTKIPTTSKPESSTTQSTMKPETHEKVSISDEEIQELEKGKNSGNVGVDKVETSTSSEKENSNNRKTLPTSSTMDTNETMVVTKPKSVQDFINSAVEAVKHMSKIQFSYMIISALLLLNAVIFLVMYCCNKQARNMRGMLTDQRKMYYVDNSCVRVLILLVMFLFFFAYIGIETTFGGLIMTFTVDFMHWTKKQGTIVTSIFWGSLAAGRGFSVFIAGCCKPRTMLIIDLFFMLLGSSLLSFTVHQSKYFLWIGTLCLGIGMSSVFPSGLSWTEQYFHMTGKSTAVLVTGSALGQMIIPVATGYVFENYSQMYLMYIVFVLTIACIVLYTVMQVLASKCGRQASQLMSSNGFLPLNTHEDANFELDSYGTTSENRNGRQKGKTHAHGKEGYDLLPLANGDY